MKKIIILFFITGLFSLTAKAQIWKEYSSFYRSVGVQLGTRGIGIEGSYPLNEQFNLRLGGSIFPSMKMKYRQQKFKLNRSDISLFGDWQPLYGRDSWIARKWIVSAGAGYFFENKLTRYKPETQVSNEPKDYELEWSKFRPYVGTGLNGIAISRQLNLSVNLGYYIPTSSYKLKTYDMGSAEVADLENKIESLKYSIAQSLNVQVGISYIFFKNSYHK
ncbi:hypothetical protein GCM10023231_03520 [Olivibacter ginsenosidimutans]|uniref:Outer membrane protein beta-barrel domain-containing protein n=1 Tax=Olivibacter ginsenosidimutans TaxID=1176537 RepID=A0ABP9AEY8_9SPHI